jgi:hypothetical protein
LSFGQGANGTITGTVTDPSGAVIADARIQVKNNANGQVYTAVSTATGNYSVLQVPVGTYDLSATVAGFKTYNRVGLDLAAAQTMRIDVPLEVGAVGDSVTVTAEASLLKTEDSALVHNVTVSQMNNLPILSVGGTGTAASSGFRDPFALASMIPGINYGANATMVINGNPDDTMQIRIEGQTAGNTGGLRQYTGQTQPSVDAVQEVAVQTSNFAAEFGTAGGGIFNVTMKSGTNDFHGSVYDYSANEALNASQPYTALKTKTRRFDYGFTIGGPVRIPKLYDGRNKTFFFWSYEQFRERLNITSTTATVPTADYRAGNFAALIPASGNRFLREACATGATTSAAGLPCVGGSANYIDPLGNTILDGTIFDPSSTRDVFCPATGANCTPGATVSYRSLFPGNAIPVARFDPVSAKVIGLVPLPEGPNAASGQLGNNFQRPWASKRVSNLPSLKIDQTIGSTGRLSGYVQDTGTTSPYSFPNGNAEGLPEPITVARGTFIYTRTIRVNYDHTITPTMLLHIGAGWFHNNFDDHSPVLDNYGPVNTQTLLGLKPGTVTRTFPLITTFQSQALGGMSNIGTGGQGNSFERRPSGVVNLSWVKNNHSYKFGSEYRLEKYPQRTFTNTTGNYSFATTAGTVTTTNGTLQTALQGRNLSQGQTGFGLASFMLGQLQGAILAQPLVAGTSKTQWAFFAQDTWKVSRKFTLDYGLRWDYGTYAKEQYGRFANFDPNLPNASAGGHPGGQVYEAICKCNFAKNYPYALGPRVGVAYQINDKTVLRGGFGVVYTATGTVSGSAVNDANAGTPGFGQSVGLFRDGIPSVVQPQFPNFNSNAGQPNGAVVAGPGFLDANAGRPAKQYQWSVGLQRELSRNTVVEVSYVANRGVWWTSGTGNTPLSALNYVSPATLSRYGFSLNSASDGTLLNKQISGLNTTERSTLASRGVISPYANYSTGQTVRQMLVQFPQYSGGANPMMAPTQAPLGKTWYDALQVNLTQRFTRGLSFNVNYALSKNLDLMGTPDVGNTNLGKNLSANDIPQQLRMTAEYQVPKLRGNKVVSAILGDWGIGWYFQYQSAPVLARPANQGSQPISQWLGRGPGPAQYVAGQPLYSTNWTDYDGKVHTDELDINCHCFDPTKNVVLNAAAWSNIPNGQWGAQQSTIRQFRGIRTPNENINISRNFRIKERVVFHVRAEFANAMNRMRLLNAQGNQLVTIGNFTATQTKQQTGSNAGLYNGGFGTIVPLAGTFGQRSGTLIARLTF